MHVPRLFTEPRRLTEAPLFYDKLPFLIAIISGFISGAKVYHFVCFSLILHQCRESLQKGDFYSEVHENGIYSGLYMLSMLLN